MTTSCYFIEWIYYLSLWYLKIQSGFQNWAVECEPKKKERQYTMGRQDIYLSSSNFLFDLLRQSIPNVVILQTQLQIFPIYSEQVINLKVLPTRLSWSQLLSRGGNEWRSKCWFHLPPPNCFCNYLEWEHHLIPMGTWWETHLCTWHLSPRSHRGSWGYLGYLFPDRELSFPCRLFVDKKGGEKQVSRGCKLT